MEYGMAGESGIVNVTGNKVAPAFKEDFAEVANACRVIEYNQVVKFRNRSLRSLIFITLTAPF